MAEDLYGILEVDKTASEAEIKKSYRKLARQYHPDVNKDAGAEDKFKKIQRAYEILSTPEKKARYDQFGVADDSASGSGFGGGFEGFSGFGGGAAGFGGFDDIFDAFFGGSGGRRGQRGPRQGEDLRYDFELNLEEAAEGLEKELEIYHMESCSKCSGSGAQEGTSKTTCGQCNGAGQVRTVQRTMLGNFSQVSTCPACHGEGSVIKNPCTNCHGKGIEKRKKKLRVNIPEGVSHGSKIRIAGEGNHGEGGGPAGDLYLFISVTRHRYFERDGDDLHLDLTLQMTQAILGTDIDVPLLKGTASLKIPAGTQNNTVFKLKGKGIPHLKGYGRGDLFVRVHVDVPKSLSGKEKTLVKELASLLGEDRPETDPYRRLQRR